MTKPFLVKPLLASTLLFCTAVVASEQPNATDLVGKIYGGAHLLHINTDNDRLMTANPQSNVDHGTGFGGELGYRFTESTEFRFSYSKINLVSENWGFSEPKSSSAVVDALYFPTKQNFYVVGGIDYLDIVNTHSSLDLGAGYRHYITDKAAIYFEGKGHYQFANHFKDASAKIGFIYFFGDSTKSRPAKKSQPVQSVAQEKSPAAPVAAAAPVAIVAKDTDQDGIVDSQDKCANTPSADKVNADGCTVFSENKESIELLVNFDNNKSVVKEEFFNEIAKISDVMNRYPDASLVIEGHTSKVGSRAYNQKISQKRAQAVVDVLVNKFSINADRLTAVGYGEDRLIDNGDTAEAHAKNRRIEAKLEVTKKVAVKR